MTTERDWAQEARELGSTEEQLLRIAIELESIYWNPPSTEDLLFEALETIRHGLLHHPSVQNLIDRRESIGIPSNEFEVRSEQDFPEDP